MAEKHMLDSSSASADFEGASSEQKRIKLEEQLVQTQGKVSGAYEIVCNPDEEYATFFS